MAKDDFVVGFGKPPEKTRFKKGQSGNPKGRPKEAPSLLASYEKIRREPVTVTLGGKPRKFPTINAVLRRHVHAALSGSARAFEAIMRLEDRLAAVESTDARPLEKDAQQREAVLDFLKSCSRSQDEVAPKPSSERPRNEIE